MATLEVAATIGNIDMLYALLRQDPKLLEVMDEQPFVDSPLHIAASSGCTEFALEMLRLKPSFGRKLNPHGFTPLHLALREGHTNTVEWLVKRNPELIRVQGKGGITPLHYVAERGDDDDVHHLAEFLMACPASIKDLTARGETAVHLAVRNRRLQALKVLYGWLYHTDNKGVLNCQDIDGNTALHLAVSTNQPEIVKLLIRRDEKNAKNSQDKTALDIATEFPEEENKQVRKILKKHSVAKCSSLNTSQKMADFLSSNPRYAIIGSFVSPEAAYPFVLTAIALFMMVAETRLLLLAERYPWLRRRNFQKMMRDVVSCKYPEQLDK